MLSRALQRGLDPLPDFEAELARVGIHHSEMAGFSTTTSTDEITDARRSLAQTAVARALRPCSARIELPQFEPPELTRLILFAWPQPAVESFREAEQAELDLPKGVTLRWLSLLFSVSPTLKVRYHPTVDERGINDPKYNRLRRSREGCAPVTNSATRLLEQHLWRSARAGGNNARQPTMLDQGRAQRIIQADPARVLIYWRGAQAKHGKIPLCGRHLKEWPPALGPLRLAHCNLQLFTLLTCSGGPATLKVWRDIIRHYLGAASLNCRLCAYENHLMELSPLESLRLIEAGSHQRRKDEGRGPLADPALGQALVMPLTPGEG